MLNKKRIIYIFSAIISVTGIITLIPVPFASKPNIIGYKSLCSFAPISTIIMLLIAGIVIFTYSRKNVSIDT